ncbi:MAG: NERD domain-containing protein [Kaiparowitsia implicata GSE-PSE-MK54-09C]|jgi:hypothetical protein|nr:NERD domain-containing protein [Kaiparowitsia implicata GSE-PSE-MK54-09C]
MFNKRPPARISPLTDNPLRNPGQSLDEEISRILDEDTPTWVILLLLGLFWPAYEWFRWLTDYNPHPILATVPCLIMAGYAVFQLYGTRKTIRRLKMARDGEKAVGQYLSDLREQGHRVYHDVIGKNFNIDHVIVSDRGIFTVETKTYSKPSSGQSTLVFDGEQITFYGKPLQKDALQQAKAQAKWLHDLLQETTGRDLPVKPVVVFPGWFIEKTAGAKTSPVWVLNPKALPTFLENEPRRIPAEDVKLVAYHLSRYIRVNAKD